jgi:DNA-binding XRE family transcriptional regulator
MIVAKKPPKSGRRGPPPSPPAPGNPWPNVLRKLREANGLTQIEAAERVGVAARTWIGWENSQSQPSRLALNLLRAAFPKVAFPE